ncbi:hypothetical protein ONA91_19325 [Micromonospora sp. DR5-3]|uniref:hypothetical protein n=1 Tax=unclassified Micromonospora TaxID=2617518 RepID=UPI0011DB8FB4|nr:MULTISPECIES: hypothetical protein [unclassified Micromonospora]MCW3816600.1 hypothetical protein [Micromonospora sp. DR5-3]TYC23051.1 hypothetical protein FXF52_17850 [Micromonospora sp. MP36]
MENGVPGGPDPLDMDTLFHQVESELRGRGQPIPQRRSRNGGNRIALVRNRAAGTPGETPARTYEQPRRHRVLPWSVAAGLVVAAAGLASILALDRDPRTPQVIGSTPPGVSAGPATSSRTATAPTMTSTTLPRTEKVTASWRHEVSTSDDSIQIGLTGVNQDGIFFYVVTPETSCSVRGSEIGESIVVTQRDGVWIRFVLLRRLFPTADATSDDFDTPVVFQVQWGRGKAPGSSRPCQ